MARKILLVDDHPDVLEITAYMLEEEGYEVICASSVQRAHEAASKHDDLYIVITDLNLAQGVSGVDMGVDMRRNGLGCPVLVMSGGLEPEQIAQHDRMGYLSKPFDRDSLRRKITELAGE